MKVERRLKGRTDNAAETRLEEAFTQAATTVETPLGVTLTADREAENVSLAQTQQNKVVLSHMFSRSYDMAAVSTPAGNL